MSTPILPSTRRRRGHRARWWASLIALATTVLTVGCSTSRPVAPPPGPITPTPAAAASAPTSPATSPVPVPCVITSTDSGDTIPATVQATAQRTYVALATADLSTLQSLDLSWNPTVASQLQNPSNRQALKMVLCQPPAHNEGYTFHYDTAFQVNIGSEGSSFEKVASFTFPDTTCNSVSGTVPTLGDAGWTPYARGFGQVRPNEANAGGDGTSVVTNLHWQTWGGPTATATGTASWVAPNAASYQGIKTPAVVTASDPGPCHGHFGYRKLSWYFPSKGDTPDSSQGQSYPDICTPSN